MTHHVVFDTDPGVDDALALLWLASLCHQGHCNLDIVTTVEGNVAKELTYDNAGRLLKIAGLENTVVGLGTYQRGGRSCAAHVHGFDGLGGLSELLPEPQVPVSNAPDSVDIILKRLSQASPRCSLLAVGPLTNLALAEAAQPGILRRPKEIIVMGGAVRQGNVTPHAEFNIHFDPGAAQTVFQNTKDLILIPLNVTRKLVFTQSHARMVGDKNSHGIFAQLIEQLTEFMTSTAVSRGATEGFFVHDAATVAYLMYPELLSFSQGFLSVDLSDTDRNGETVVDFGADSDQCNAWVATDIQAEEVLNRLCDDLRYLAN
ncbi:MAG: nucleoside hydrolase [Pseudomonadota bacterium]